MLAGISTEYYLRLEQGRDHQPSDQVLDGLARALQLDDDAGELPSGVGAPGAASAPDAQSKKDSSPAVQDSHRQLAVDPGVRHQQEHDDTRVQSTSPERCHASSAPGENILRAAFLEPEMRMLYRDWDRFTTRIVPFCASRARRGATRSRTRRADRRTQPRQPALRRVVGASRRQASKHRSDRLLSPASRAARSALHDPAPTGSTTDDHHLPRRPVHHPSRISVCSPAWQAKRRRRRDWSRMLLVEHEHDFALPTGVALAEA